MYVKVSPAGPTMVVPKGHENLFKSGASRLFKKYSKESYLLKEAFKKRDIDNKYLVNDIFFFC